jgi:RNA polymerase sigma-70 factor (ECF subfamily)
MPEDVMEAAISDTASFAELVREHQAMVFSIANACLRDRAAAEEVAQDVFMQLYRTLDTLESPAHVVHWLRRAAAHRAIDRTRRWGFRRFFSMTDAPEPAAPALRGDPLLDGVLRQLVASLPPKLRMVVILRYQEDLDVADIARVMEVPLRRARSYLQRSLALLRDKVSRRCGEISL